MVIYFAIQGFRFANCNARPYLDVEYFREVTSGGKIAVLHSKKGGHEMSRLISPGDVMLMLGLDLTFEEVLDLTAGLTAHISFKSWYKIIKAKDNGVVTNMKITYIGFDKMDVSKFFRKHDPWEIIREGRELRNQGKGVIPMRYILKGRRWIEYTKAVEEVQAEELAAAL